MNKEIIEGKAKKIEGAVQQKWGEMTDDPADVAAGAAKKVQGQAKETYGHAKEAAEDLMKKTKSDNCCGSQKSCSTDRAA